MSNKYRITIVYANRQILESRKVNIESVAELQNGLAKSLQNRSFYSDKTGAFNTIINPMAIVGLTVTYSD